MDVPALKAAEDDPDLAVLVDVLVVVDLDADAVDFDEEADADRNPSQWSASREGVRVPLCVNLGRTGPFLRIGVMPSALVQADARAVRAALLHALGDELDRCVDIALSEVTQSLQETLPELVEDITENINEGELCQNGQYGETEGPEN